MLLWLFELTCACRKPKHLALQLSWASVMLYEDCERCVFLKYERERKRE